MQTELDIQCLSNASDIPGEKQFNHWVSAVLAEKRVGQTVTIRIVDEKEAQRLNRKYRQRDYATNVLSFPAELPEGLPVEIRQSQLGDLLLCAPVVKREAQENGRPEEDHWAHLTIHGILHLLGYDHDQPETAGQMEAREIEILGRLGIPDPYQDCV